MCLLSCRLGNSGGRFHAATCNKLCVRLKPGCEFVGRAVSVVRNACCVSSLNACTIPLVQRRTSKLDDNVGVLCAWRGRLNKMTAETDVGGRGTGRDRYVTRLPGGKVRRPK